MNYDGLPKSPVRSRRQLNLTSTDVAAPLVMPMALLTGIALQADTEILQWKEFFSRLLNPMEYPASQDVVWMILLQVEDWDHFLEHARNPAVQPSFDLLKRKFGELTYLIDSVGNHLEGRIIVGLLPPPDEVSQNPELMEFRNKLCRDLINALSDYSSICVCVIPKQPYADCDRSAQTTTTSGKDSMMVYRIPINTRGMGGEG